MKFIFKKALQYYLKYITKLLLFIHRPVIIVIAGSTNKTFVKEEIKRILEKNGIDVRANQKNFNTEIGLPLSILYLSSGYNSYKSWIPIIIKAFINLFKINFPKFLVLELGVSDHGDMKYLLSIIRPKIAIITNITQRYLEGFQDMNNLAAEYELLIKKVKKNGFAILNYDNIRIRKVAYKSKIKVEFFGFQDGADWQAIDARRGDLGQIIKVSHDNIIEQYKILRFGEHHVYALLVGLAIKKYLGLKYDNKEEKI